MSARKTMVGDINDDVLSFTVGKDPQLDAVLLEWDCVGTAAHVSMLQGLPPFLILRPSDLKKIFTEEPLAITRADCPRRVLDLIRMTMQKSPDDRPPVAAVAGAPRDVLRSLPS